MFIAKKQIIVDYCNWLFDILFELEKKTQCDIFDLREAYPCKK